MLQTILQTIPITALAYITTNSIQITGAITGFMSAYFFFNKDDATVEDVYQVSRRDSSKNGVGSFIYANLTYNGLLSPNAIISINNKLGHYNYLYNQQHKTHKIDNVSKRLFFYKDDYNSCDDNHYKILFDRSDKIKAVIKHEYIGGSYLLQLFHCFLSKRQKDVESLFPKTNLLYILLFPKLLWFLKITLPRIKPLPLYKNDDEMMRYRKSHKMSIIENSKSIIIYDILRLISKTLSLKRDLICYLPIAFQPIQGIRNNIGLIWILFNENDTIEQFTQKLKDSSWQAAASNACIQFLPSSKNIGKNTRKAVDIVLTFLLGKDEDDIEVSWTFERTSDYPIYIAISSIMTNTHLMITETITSSTPILTLEKLHENQQDSIEKFRIAPLEEYV